MKHLKNYEQFNEGRFFRGVAKTTLYELSRILKENM